MTLDKNELESKISNQLKRTSCANRRKTKVWSVKYEMAISQRH